MNDLVEGRKKQLGSFLEAKRIPPSSENKSRSLEEREMLWELEQQASVSRHSFFEFSQTFTSVSIKQLDYELVNYHGQDNVR